MSNTDVAFITNEEQQNLKGRFRVLIKDTKFFDCLVGYFYTSSFHAVYKSLENAERIRIMIGISTSKLTYDLLTKVNQNQCNSLMQRQSRNIQGLSKKRWRIRKVSGKSKKVL